MMSGLRQAKLLLWKNILLRYRYPATLALEVIWPILMIGIVALMRSAVPPYKHGNCHYHPRAMPSAGAVPFLQTYLCNLDNRCYSSETELNQALAKSHNFAALSQDLGPYFSSDEVLDVLAISDKGVTVIETMRNVLGDKELMHGLESTMYIRNYFKDPEKVQSILERDFNMSPSVSEAIMHSQFNVAQLLNLTGTPDFRAAICDPATLGLFITFPEGVSLKDVSSALCSVQDTQLEDFANNIISQLNITAFIDALKLFEQVKTNIGVYSLSTAFDSIARMFEVVMSSEPLISLLGDFMSIPNIADIIRRIPEWVDEFDNLESAISSLKSILSALEPLMISLDLEDSPIWVVSENAVHLGINFMNLGEGKWNGTSEEFIQPLEDLLSSLQNLTQSKEGQQLQAVMDFFSKVDWPGLYNEIIQTGTIDERTILHILDVMEDMMKELPEYSTVQMMTRLGGHSLDIMAIVTEKSTELKHALNDQFKSNGPITDTLNRLFQYGPDVINGLLNALRSSTVVGDLLKNATDYQSVCERVMEDMKNQLPEDVFQDVHGTLCAVEVDQAFTHILDSLKLTEISTVINSTVQDLTALYEGDFYDQKVNFTSLYHRYVRFTQALNDYLYDQYTWEEVFNSMTLDSWDTNMPGWESVADNLNSDFLTTGILGAYRGLGSAMANSRVSKEIGPYVHMMSEMSKMMYTLLQHVTTSYGSESPLVEATTMFSQHLPEIVKGIQYMWKNNITALYNLAASADPLATFCDGKYMSQMNMPAYLPIGEMNDLVCHTNWTAVVIELSQPIDDMQNIFEKMTDLIEVNTTTSYDIELDWIDLMDYTERVIDIIFSGDLNNADFTMGYQAVIESLNFTQFFNGVDQVFQVLENITMEEDIEKLVTLVFKSLEQMENTEEFMLYVALVDAYMDMQIQVTEDVQERNSLKGMIESYSPYMWNLTTQISQAYPELIMAMKNILLYPEKLIDMLLRDGFSVPDCNTHFVTDYTLLPANSSMHKLEKTLCEMNITAVLEDLMTSQTTNDFEKRLADIISGDHPASVNWTALVDKTIRYIKLLDSPMYFNFNFNEGFDLSPFNISAISMSWQEFYEAADSLKDFDMNRFQEVSFKLQQLLMGDSSNLTMALYSGMYVSHQFVTMINSELLSLNSSQEVILFEFLGVASSGEMMKLRNLLLQSPEINAVGVATLERLLTHPEKAMVNTDFDELCADLAVFSKVFVVEVASITPAVLQKTVCDLNINFTLLGEELMNNRASLKKFVDAMDVLNGPYSESDLKVNVTEVIDGYNLMSQLLEDLINHPPVIKITNDERWMNMTLYSQDWERLGRSLSQLGTDLSNSSIMIDWESALANLLYTTIEEIPEGRKVLGYLDVILDIMQKQLDETTDGLAVGSLAQYPNANTFLDLLTNAPEVVETALYTILTEPSKTGRWTLALQSWTDFCGTPTSTIFSVPPDLTFSMEVFVLKACSIDYDELIRELNTYQSVDNLNTLLTNGTYTEVNSTVVSQKFETLVRSLTNYLESPDSTNEVYLRLFNTTVWEQIGARIDQWSNITMNFSPDKISKAITDFAYTAFGDLSIDAIQIYKKLVGLTNAILDEVLHALKSKTFSEAFESLSSMEFIVNLLNDLPELFETVLYTSLHHNNKLSNELSQVTSFESFCAIKPEELLVLAPNSTWDAKAWFDSLCSLNLTNIVDELTNTSLIYQVDKFFSNGTITGPDDISGIFNKMEKIVTQLTEEGITTNERVFKANVWETVLTQINSWTLTPDVAIRSTESLLILVEEILNSNPNLHEEIRPFIVADAVAINLLDILLSMENKTHFGAADFFKGWTNMQKILELLQMPGSLDIVLASLSSSDHFLSLFTNMSALEDLCLPSTPANKYLTAPDNALVNLQQFRTALCDIDFDGFIEQFNDYFNMDYLTRLANGTADFPWSDLQIKIDRFTNMIERWTDNPPEFDLPDLWTNTSYWTNLFSTDIAEQLSTKDQIESMLSQLGPLLDMDGFKQVGIVLNSVMDILNDNLVAMENANYTLSNVVMNIPALHDLFNAMGLNGDTMTSLLFAPIKNTTRFAELFLTDDFKGDFCSTDKWREIIAFPIDFDTSTLFTAICAENMEPLVMKLKETFNLESMIAALNDNSSHVQDWKDASGKILKLVDNVKALIEHPPSVSSDNTLELLSDRYSNTTELWNMLAAFSALEQSFGNETVFIGEFKGVSSVANVLLNFLDDILARIKVQHGRLDLASLFKDVPGFVQMIEGVLTVDPDPITGLFSVQLKPSKVDIFTSMISDSSQLEQLFCDKDIFQDVFLLRDNVNISALLHVLCDLDFEVMEQQLKDSFKINTLGQDLENAWTTGVSVDVEKLMDKVENIIAHIENLTLVDHLMFGQHDLGDLLLVNVTQLMEALSGQFENMQNINAEDYVHISTSVLNDLLKNMDNVTEVRTLTLALQFTQMYLHSFNTFLKSIKDQPISLALLLNTTEVGQIINPILTDPHQLDALADLNLDIRELSKILDSPDPIDGLCSDDLWLAVLVPANGIQPLIDLQNRICSVNQSLLLWQTVMVQANGYYLYKQMDVIEQEINEGRRSLNITAVGQEMADFIDLMSTIIEQYLDGSRTLNGLLDLNSFQQILDNTQRKIAETLIEQASNWSADIADILLPRLLEKPMLETMAKTLNTVNLMMNLTIQHLQGLRDGTVSTASLFNNVDALVDLIEAYIRVGKNLAQSWLDGEFDLDKMVNLLKDIDQVKSLCSQSGGLTSHLTDQISPSDTVKDMSVVICSVTGDRLTTEFQNFVNYTDIEEQLQAIWNGSDVSPNYRAFTKNVEEFTSIIEELSNKSLTVSSSLSNTFDFGSTLKSLENIATNPSMIFSLLKLAGLAIDGPMSKEPEAVRVLAGMNTFAIMPMVNVLQALEGKGLSLETIVQDPDTLLDVLEVLLDFNTHSSVMETVVLKSMVNEIDEQRDHMCNSTSYENEMTMKVSTLSLPVPWKDIYSVVCTSDSSVLLKKLTDMSLTNVQIVILFQKMLDEPDVSTLPDMYNKDFSWMDLMSSLESMTKLLTLDKMDRSSVTHVRTTWNAVKDIVFDKSLNSVLQYLQLAESSQGDSESWVTFKQFLRFFSSALDFVSSNVDKLGGGSTIQLQDVLPNSTHVASLIEDVFGTNSPAEILTTSIDPIMFYRMSLTNTWDKICGGDYALNDFFHFPVGTDVNSVQNHLCQAVTTRTTSFEELLSLFDAKDMLTQLDMLIQGQFNSSAHNDTVFDAFHSAVMKLVHAGEAMQQGYVDPDSVNSWLQPILTTLSSLQIVQDSQLVAMCDSLVMYMNQTEDFLSVRDTLSMVMTTVNLVTDMARIVPALDEVTCILLNGSSIDVIGAVDKLNSFGMWHNIKKAFEEFLHPPLRLNCTAPLLANQMLMDVINSSIVGSGLDTVKMFQCLGNTEDQLSDLITSFSKTMSLFKDIMEILQTPSVQEFLSNQDLMPVLHFIFDNIDANQQNILALTDLITDKISAGDYMVNSLGLPRSAVDSFLNASVNQDQAYFLMEPVQVLTNVLCDPVSLSEVISLHSNFPINITQLSFMLCAQNVMDVAHFLKNISISGSNISQVVSDLEVDTVDVVTSMVSHISEMVMDFEDIISLITVFVDDFSLDTLEEHVDIIDRVLQSNTLTQLAESIQNVFNDIKLLLPSEGDSRDILDDISKIVDGILGLDLFKDMLMQSLQVKDLVKDPAYLTFYMTTQLGFNKSISTAIMDGTFSARMLLGMENKQPYSCDEVIKMLIILNSTQATMNEISQAVCSLSQEELTDLMTALTPELDIGHLVAKYVAYTGKVFLETANMNTTELNDMVETIDSSSVVLQRATEIIETSPNASDIIDIFYGGQAGAFVSLEELTPAMCGGKVVNIFDTNFDPGIVLTSADDIMADIEMGIEDNQLDLPNEFCVEMYETIRSSGIGGILWSYLKPIIRGKILYTPDNAVTRAIVAKANGTFALLDEIHTVSSIWAQKTPNLLAMVNMINNTDDIRDALENEFVQGLIQATIGINGNSLISSLDAVLSNNFDSKQLAGLQTAAEIIANYTSCITTDRFVPVATEEELEVMAYTESQSKTFLAGLVFTNTEEENTPSNRRRRQAREEIPKHVSYKIRMDVDNVMDTSRLKSHIWQMTSEDSFVENMRYLRGFIYIQDMVDNAIIDLHKNEIHTAPGFRIRQMPFPCHHEDDFIFMLGSYLIPVMMTFVFLASLGVATHNLVSDKENGQEETLHVMGMVRGLNLFSWFISTMFIMMVVSLILTFMLKYTDIFIYSNILIIFLYLSDFCLSSVMLLYMVSSFFNRTTMAILFVLMVYLISYLPYILVVGLELNMHFWHKIVASLASTTAFSFGSLNLAYLEESGTGVQWDNIEKNVMKDFSIHWACIMMLVDSGIYFLVGWYVRHVKPGKYGISQPWYFPIKPSFWSSCFSSGGLIASRPASSQANRSTEHLFQERTGQHDVGIAVENLSKTYSNKKKALENLTVNFYKGEITSLLGHNGAAKSTTLNMICGVLEPTSGQVLINGSSTGCCKPSLGVCPQQNALFNYMTVLEHMKLYAGMKGAADSSETRAEMTKLLRDVDLWHHRSTSVGNLSYGTKRRLCVALAFVGGSDTVVLDEPTSGVDPHARKNIWNLITKNRPGRTILLSTHHLDEADILSDQVAIMHEGRLLCCGSPAFLKNSLGGGFQLTVVKKNQLSMDNQAETLEVMDMKSERSNSAILSYIQTMCPLASLVEQVGLDLTFNLPKDESSMKVSFYQFFRQLEESSNQLGIASYGLSDTTLEEIFLQLTEGANTSIDEGVINPVMTSRDRTTLTLNEHSEINETLNVDLKKRQSGLALTWSQVMALLIKRFHHYRRNWRMLLTCALLPLLGFFIAMGFTTARPEEADMQALVLDPAIYGPDVYSFYRNEAKNQEAYRFSEMLTSTNVGIGTTCMRDFAHEYFDDKTCLNPSPWANTNYTINLVFCSNARQVYKPINAKMSIPEMRLPSNQYIQDLENINIPSYILRTFRDFTDKRFGGWSFEPSEDGSSIEVDPYVWFNSKGYHSMPSFFNSLSNTVLRAHLPNGEDPTEYGITAVNHPIRLGRSPLSISNLQKDAADAGIALMLVVSFSLIPGGFIVYTINEKMHKQRQLQNISGVGLLIYWIVAFLWDLLVYAISVAVAAAMVAIIQPDAFFLRDNLSAFVSILLLYGWSIIPCMYCLSRIFQQGSTAFLVTFCLNLFIALITVISLLVMQLFQESDTVRETYKICKYLFLIFPQYALGQGLMDLVSNIFKYKIFLRFDEDIYESPYSRDVIGWNLIALAIQGVVFFILTLIMDTIVRPPISIPKESKTASFDNEDEDVMREKNRIQHGPKNDLLVVDNLTKVYRRGLKKFLAVDHISFGVPQGESFGLLGVNGAGKTTTFRMLTGDLKPAGGSAFLKGHLLSANDQHFGQDVGYCPQEGGLDEYLTGSETLHFHARLRGFDSHQRNGIVTELLSRLHLIAYAHKAVHTYSGGTRRKLALAVALLGEPPILYLDEPTTGMDAGTRRLAWSCIARAKRNGQAVVLTSHTMDECGALCSRIAIMVNGQIKCIGSPQHLKHKFGKGYTVMMHTSHGSPRNVAHAFMNRFPGTIIKSEHINSTQLQVPHDSGSVADIIAALQKAEDDGIIQYYSISQTTLDAVFVSFVQEQQDNFEENLVNESSFSDSYDTPSGSISSSKSTPSSTSWPRKKSESNYIFTNPQFVPDDVRTGAVPDGRNYSNNIVLGTEQPEVRLEDLHLKTKL